MDRAGQPDKAKKTDKRWYTGGNDPSPLPFLFPPGEAAPSPAMDCRTRQAPPELTKIKAPASSLRGGEAKGETGTDSGREGLRGEG